MADPSTNKELAWSMTLDDKEFEKVIDKNGLKIKNFDKLLKQTTETALSMQKALANIKVPDLGEVKTTTGSTTLSSTASTKAAEDSIIAYRKQARLLKMELSELSEEELKNSKAAADLAKEYSDIQSKITAFNKSLKGTGAEVKNVQIGTLKAQFEALGININELSKEQLKSIKITKDQATALSSNVNSYNKQAASLNLNNKIIRTLNKEQVKNANIGGKVLKNIKEQDAALKEFDETTGRFQRSVGNYRNSLLDVIKTLKFTDSQGKLTFSSLAGGFSQITKLSLGFGLAMFGVNGAIAAFQKLNEVAKFAVNTLSEFSDVVANVQKVTNQTDAEFTKMAESLKKIDARTALNELLQIVEAGGKFQVPAEDLAKFAETVNVVLTGLKGDLEGSADDITLSLIKINTAFKGLGKADISEGVKAVGSAINELAQRTTAQAEPIKDYTNRLIGLAGALELSPEKVLALGAAFDQAGISAETSATATNKLLLNLGDKTAEAAKVAGKSFKKFSQIVSEDPIEALNLFAAGLVSTGTDVNTLAADLDDFGLKGARVASTLLALGKSQQEFARNTKIAKDELKDANSITAEYERVNNTLAGSLEKLKNEFTGFFQSVEDSKSIQKVIDVLRNGLVPALTFVGRTLEGLGGLAGIIFEPFLIIADGLNKRFEELSGVSFTGLYNELFNLTEQTKTLSFFAFLARETFDAIAGQDLSQQLKDSADQLERVRRESAQKLGFSSWEEFQASLKKVETNATDATKAIDNLEKNLNNVKLPDFDIAVDKSNISNIENQIVKLTNAKKIIDKSISDLVNLPIQSGLTRNAADVARATTDQIQEAIIKSQKAITDFKAAEADRAIREQLKKELAATEESLKTTEQRKEESFKRTNALLKQALDNELISKEKYNTLILAADEKLREDEKKAAQKAIDDIEKERQKANEKYKTLGASRLEILEQEYNDELEKLRILEDQKIELSKSYDEIRLGLLRDFNDAKAEIEEEDSAAKIERIRKENEDIINTTQFTIDSLGDILSQLAIEGESIESVLKNVGKSFAKFAVDIITSKLKIAVTDKIIEASSLASSIAVATPAAKALTSIWTPAATLASTATFGGAAAAGAAGIIGALQTVRSATQQSGGGGGASLGTPGFENTGGLAGLIQAPSQALIPNQNGQILQQLEANAFNQSQTDPTQFVVEVNSSDPDTTVQIRNARGQFELEQSGFNTEEF